MKRHSMLHHLIAVAALCAVLGPAPQASAAGSPGTRLIGLGINYLTLAPFTPGQLFEIDKQTGVASPLGAPFVVEAEGVGANLAADSAGQLFNAWGSFSGSRINRLAFTGEVEQFTPLTDGTSYPPYVYPIAFDSQDQLHGILLNGDPAADAIPVLAEINVTTGLATTLTIVESYDATGLAFDAADNLYAAAASVGLMRINRVTGQATIIGGDLTAIGPVIFGPRPIVFDRDGTLLAATDRLLVVDPSTGAATAVGGPAFGTHSIVGLAIVPEPSAASLGLAAWFAGTSLARTGRAGRRW